jgi:hypothetical protein
MYSDFEDSTGQLISRAPMLKELVMALIVLRKFNTSVLRTLEPSQIHWERKAWAKACWRSLEPQKAGNSQSIPTWWLAIN